MYEQEWNDRIKYVKDEIKDKKETIKFLIFNQGDKDLIDVEIEALEKLNERLKYVEEHKDELLYMFLKVDVDDMEEIKKYGRTKS